MERQIIAQYAAVLFWLYALILRQYLTLWSRNLLQNFC